MATERLFFSCIVLLALTGAGTAWGQTAGFAYVANCGSPCDGANPGNVSAYRINGITGALTEVDGSPFPAGAGSHSVTVDPTGQFAYVANLGSNNVSAYSIEGITGALTPVGGSPFPAEVNPISVTVAAAIPPNPVSPTGQFAYVANLGSNNVSAYSIGTTGALTPVGGSPFAAGVSPTSVRVDPTGQFVYAANLNSNNVSAYVIKRTGGLLPLCGSPFPAGVNPHSVTVDPTGQFAYVANSDSNNVSAYTIDGNTGALTEVDGSPFPAGVNPRSVTVDPTGQFAYVVNSDSNNVSAYRINGITGALTEVDGSPFPAGSVPISVTTTEYTRTPARLANYYTINNGVSFSRSLTPTSAPSASGEGTIAQTVNPDGSITVSISGVPGYADSGFYLHFGALGNLNTIVARAITGSDPFGLNLWFDKDGNGEYFVWNQQNVLTGLGNDSYISAPASQNGLLSINDNTLFTSMQPGGGNYTLAQLKNGAAPGINETTPVAIWVGVAGGGGNLRATIDCLSVNGLASPCPPPK